MSAHVWIYLWFLIVPLLRTLTVDSQKIQYATRFRNFTVSSETDSIYAINVKIFQHNMEHRLAGILNITKNVHAKSITVIVRRCIYDRFVCENFQTWKFQENLKAIVYMKNQIWTPLFTTCVPKLDLPVVKRNAYSISNATLSVDSVILFYPEATKYYFQADAILNDVNGKKGIILNFEVGFFEYVERNRKRISGN